MKTMTCGEMPTRDEFQTAFEDEVPGGNYRIRNDRFLGDLDLTESELWDLVSKLNETASEDSPDCDAALDRSAAILSTLGFEWI